MRFFNNENRLERAPAGVAMSYDRELNDGSLRSILDNWCNAVSKNEKFICAAQLREAVANLDENTASPTHENTTMSELDDRIAVLLRSPDRKDRRDAIGAVRLLFEGEAESLQDRTQRVRNTFDILFRQDVTDKESALAAATLTPSLLRQNMTETDDVINFLLQTCVHHLTIGTSGPETLAVIAEVLTALATPNFVPDFMYQHRELVRNALWEVVLHESEVVRRTAVHAMIGLISIVTARGDAPEGVIGKMLLLMKEPINIHQAHVHYNGFGQLPGRPSWNTHGVLLLLSSLLKNDLTRESVAPHFAEVCKFVVPLQDCQPFHDLEQRRIREAVADILPQVVGLNQNEFVSSFLKIVYDKSLCLLKSPSLSAEEKGLVLESLGRIAREVTRVPFSDYLGNVLRFCDEQLSKPPHAPDRIPEDNILCCIRYLAVCSQGSSTFESIMGRGLLKNVFQCQFTRKLLDAACQIQEVVPTQSAIIEVRLIQMIATTLRRGLENEEDESPSDIGTGAPNSLGSRIDKMGLGFDHSLQAAGVIDDLYSTSAEGLGSLFSTKAYVSRLGIFASGGSKTNHHVGSYGSSFGSHSASGRDQGHYLARHHAFDFEVSDETLGVDSGNDKANSKCVALRAIDQYNIRTMRAGDISLFADEFVVPYLVHPTERVRLLATKACAALASSAIKSWGIIEPPGKSTQRLRSDVNKIIVKLVARVVTDHSSDIRSTALSILHTRVEIHPYLVQPSILNQLFLCLYDEDYGVRQQCVLLAGQLHKANPSQVVVPLRKLVVYIFCVLKTRGEHLKALRSECTGLLFDIIRSVRSVVDCYAEQIVPALISRLKFARIARDATTSETVLRGIAELGGLRSVVNFHKYSEELTPMIVSFILDDTADAVFRQIAILALCRLVQCTGMVIEPYEKFPELLPGLLALMRNEVDNDVRRAISNLVGCLGAVDPSNHKNASLPTLAGSVQDQHRLKPESPGSRVRDRTTYGTSVAQSYASESLFGQTAGLQAKPTWQLPTSVYQDFPDTMQTPKVSVSLFALGPEQLSKKIKQYTPVWQKSKHDEVSLVGRLEHPFSSSRDYLPSVALDKLIAIARNADVRAQNRNVFEAIVKIVKVYTESDFLHVVFPCFLWVLRPDQTVGDSADNKQVFSGFHDFVMARMSEVVAHCGSAVGPYIFDTILLLIRYIEDTHYAPKCILAVCKLLVRIKIAIGDAGFRPILDTIFSVLSEALSDDHQHSAVVVGAILRVFESCGTLLKESSPMVFKIVVGLIEFSPDRSIKECAMNAFLSLVSDAYVKDNFSFLVLVLLRLLANERDVDVQNSSTSHNFGQGVKPADAVHMSLHVANALAILDLRVPDLFKGFVSKAARICVEGPSTDGKRRLKSILLQRYPTAEPFFNSSSDENQPSSPVTLYAWKDKEEAFFPVPEIREDPRSLEEVGGFPVPHVHPDETELAKLFVIDRKWSANVWLRWIRKLEVELIKHSGSAALSACAFMVDSNPSVGRSLFNAAFLSCWAQPENQPPLSQLARDTITHHLLNALDSDSMPMNITQLILNLFEFMEHDEKPLPASNSFLARRASRCGVLAKALRYKECDYETAACEANARASLFGETGLLSIYEKLGHEESRAGATLHFKNKFSESSKEAAGQDEDNNLNVWADKLGKWDRAAGRDSSLDNSHVLDYSHFNVLASEPVSGERWSYLIKELQGLNDLGHWRATNELLKNVWDICGNNPGARRKLAIEGKGISVAFDLANWADFEDRLSYLNNGEFLTAFYRALHAVHRATEEGRRHGNARSEAESLVLDEAEKYLFEARALLDMQLTARLNEGYPRAYLDVVHVQTLCELEEMVQFLRLPKELKAVNLVRIKFMWKDRLNGCKYDQSIWYRVLMIRSLVFPPEVSKDQWIEFSALCRKSARMPLASEALRRLVNPSLQSEYSSFNVDDMRVEDVKSIHDLQTRYAVCKHLWTINRRSDAFKVLLDSAEEYTEAANAGNSAEKEFSYVSSLDPGLHSKRPEVVLAAEVLLKIGKWSHRLAKRGVAGENISSLNAIEYAKKASKMRPSFHKPWHWWARFNLYHANLLMDEASVPAPGAVQGSNGQRRPVLTKEARGFLNEGIKGYFKAVRYGGKTSLQDALKLLTMWFKYGKINTVREEFDKGFKESVVTGWLQVIPQIIARLQSSQGNELRVNGIEQLLERIGLAHPQMAVYSLIVAKTMPGPETYRRDASTRVLQVLKRKHPGVVRQAEMVARELVRVAILWSEKWFEALDEASRLYFSEFDIKGMLEIVLPLHEDLNKGPQTSFEKYFNEAFGNELSAACQCLVQIRARHLAGATLAEQQPLCNSLWEIYYNVYGRLQGLQKTYKVLHLSKVSQELRYATDMELAVPGTYDPASENVVRIQSFSVLLRIIQSKQRPRKLSVLGSDGQQYEFLLKGHEDLRQDERVMQVFGLMNQILSRSQNRSLRSGADIKRYAVVALSSEAGLIEWVPNCDTMHSLVKEHREARKIMPNIEHKVMLRVAPEPDRLPTLCKVDIFKFMMDNTSGSDIANVLWLKSRSSEVWLDRRTTYARSLAVSSMAGYLLGLGDRHPSNLMITRGSGKIMHIDFGDCFEVALARDKYPEKVPFRLTRMLVEALESCGVDGYFRTTCEAVMKLIRHPDTADSLMCMMEAFVHDPLLKMKLVGGEHLQRMKDDEYGNAILRKMMSDAGPPLLSASLNQERTQFVQLMYEAQGLEAAFQIMQQAQEQNEVPQPAELPVAGAVPVPGNPGADNGLQGLGAASPAIRSRRDRDRLLNSVAPEKSSALADRRAAIALKRILDKLNGNDFEDREGLSVAEQVDKLILEATNIENLCSLYVGWCAFW